MLKTTYRWSSRPCQGLVIIHSQSFSRRLLAFGIEF